MYSFLRLTHLDYNQFFKDNAKYILKTARELVN